MPFNPLHVLNNSNGLLVSDNTSSITILSGDTLPSDITSGYFHVSIDNEILEVTNVTMDSTNKVFAVTREAQGTIQQIHDPGSVVSLRYTAKHLTDLNSAVESLIDIVDIDTGLVDGVDISQFYSDYTGNPPSVTDWTDTTENLKTTGSGTFGSGLDVTGNIIVTGNVDGVDVSNLYSDHTSHINDFNNPHQVTADQLGLGDVTSDINNLEMSISDITSDINNIEIILNDATSNIGIVQTDIYDHTSNIPIHIDWTDTTENILTTGSGTFGNGLDVTGDIIITGTVDGVDISQFYSDYTGGIAPGGIDWTDSTNNLHTTGSGTFGNGLDVTGDIIVTGTVDGVDISQFYSDYTSGIAPGGIDWTDATNNLHTTGSGTFGSGLDITGDIIVSGTVDGVDVSNLYSDYTSHISDFNNPHQVTADQLGLGDISSDINNLEIAISDITSDINNIEIILNDATGDIGTLQTNLFDHTSNELIHIDWTDATHAFKTTSSGTFGNGLDVTGNIIVSGNVDGVDVLNLYSDYTSHISDFNNPHNVTADQLGLGDISSDINNLEIIIGDITSDINNIEFILDDATGDIGVLQSNLYDHTSNELIHIDWTDATHNLLTTGSGTFSSIDTTSNSVDGVNLPNLYSDFTSHTSDINSHINWTDSTHNFDTEGSGTFGNGLDVTGNITLTGNIDGVDVSTLYSDHTSHINDFNNPHQVTVDQLGLGDVTSDINNLEFIISDITSDINNIEFILNDATSDIGIIQTNIYDHTSNELIHIDWTDATHNLLTTGTGTFSSIDTSSNSVDGVNLPILYSDVTSHTGNSDIHINWTDSTHNFDTEGSGKFGNNLDVTGNITVTGTVDGIDVSNLYSDYTSHIADFNNPHNVTADQLGLGDVTSDINNLEITIGDITSDINNIEIILNDVTGDIGELQTNLYDHTSNELIHIDWTDSTHSFETTSSGIFGTGLDVTGNITVTGNVDGVDVSTLYSDFTSHTGNVASHINWTDATHAFKTTSSGVFGTGLDVTGNLTITGNVDGVDISTFYSDFTSHTGNSNIHIDWTNATSNLLTTGSGTFSSIDTTSNLVDGVNLPNLYSDFTSHIGNANSHIDWTNTTSNLHTTGSGIFGTGLDVTGNIAVSGTVDGVDISQFYFDFTSSPSNIDWTDATHAFKTTSSGIFGSTLDVTGKITAIGAIDIYDSIQAKTANFYLKDSTGTNRFWLNSSGHFEIAAPFYPSSDNSRSLGLTSRRWSDLQTVLATISSNAVIGGTLDVTGVISTSSTGVVVTNALPALQLRESDQTSIDEQVWRILVQSKIMYIVAQNNSLAGTNGIVMTRSTSNTVSDILFSGTQTRVSNALKVGTTLDVTGASSLLGNVTITTADNPALALRESGTTTSYTQLYNETANLSVLRHVTAVGASGGSSTLRIYPHPLDSTAAAIVEFFRVTNTSGAKNFIIYAGDGSSTTKLNYNLTAGILYLYGRLDVVGNGCVSTKTTVGTSYTQIYDEGNGTTWLMNYKNTGSSTIRIYPRVADGTSTATISFFRTTNTTGTRQFVIYKGDGTNNQVLHINAGSSLLTFYGNTDLSGTLNVASTATVRSTLKVESTNSASCYIDIIRSLSSTDGYIKNQSLKTDAKSLYIDNLYLNNGTKSGTPIIYFRLGDSTNPKNIMLLEEDGSVTTTGNLISGYATGNRNQFTYLVSASGYEKGLIFNAGFDTVWKLIDTTANDFKILNWYADTSTYDDSITISKTTNEVTIHGDLTVMGSLNGSTTSTWNYSIPMSTGVGLGTTYSSISTGTQREKFNYWQYDFGSTRETGFTFVTPETYAGEALKVDIYWTSDDSSYSGDVLWRIYMKCITDGNMIGDTTMTQLGSSVDTYQGVGTSGENLQHVHTFTNISPTNAGPGRECYMVVRRHYSVGVDTFEGYVRLIGVNISY